MIVSKTWFFEDVVTKDRFLERAFPLQSDRPNEGTFRNLVDTFAEEVVVQALSVRVTSVESRLTALEAIMPTKANISYVDAGLALKANQSDYIILEGRVDVTEANIITLTNTKADITWVQSNYPEQTEFNNAINNLQATKLDIAVYNQWKNNVVEPRLNKEHITANFTQNEESFFIPFISNQNMVIDKIEARGVTTWSIYTVKGTLVETGLSSRTITQNTAVSSFPFNFKLDSLGNVDNSVNGIVIVAHTLQSGLPQYIKPAITLEVTHIY